MPYFVDDSNKCVSASTVIHGVPNRCYIESLNERLSLRGIENTLTKCLPACSRTPAQCAAPVQGTLCRTARGSRSMVSRAVRRASLR